MNKLILIIFFALAGIKVFAQATSDFITVKKKNNITVKTIMPGMPVSFILHDGSGIAGFAEEIKNDSVYIRMFDVRTYMTQFGTTTVDTLGSFRRAISYKEIKRVEMDKDYSFRYIKNGTIFMIGGYGYVALNLINSAANGDEIGTSKNLTNLGIGAAVGTAGLILNRIFVHRERTGKKYKITYVHMNDSNSTK